MKSCAANIVAESEALLSIQGLLLDSRFEIERRVTCGSYSEIHLARNISPQPDEPEMVIVKALNLWLQGEPDADLERTLIENMALEAQTMQGFQHENIARLFSYGRALDHEGRGFYYLILEYLRGGSLSQLCRSHPLPFEQMLDYTAQICAALSYAHARRVIHRDVKPSNIMLSADHSRVKMLDFGVARHLSNDNGLITKVGTDLYAAPEHYSLSHLSGTKLTAAADVYGLAKCVYFMLCGQPPSEFKQHQITSLPEALQAQAWGADVLSILFKATSEQPLERFQSAHDFYNALQAITEQTTHSTRSRAEATLNQKRTPFRIIIDVKTKQRITLSERAKVYWKRITEDIGRVTRLAKNESRAIYTQACTLLLNRKAPCIHLWQYAAQQLRALPLKLLFRIIAVIALSLTLLIATPYLIERWRPHPSTPATQQTKPETSPERIAIAGTDINIRSSPSRTAPKIGLVERDSKVRILSFSKDHKWCEIEVIQHGRNKEDASASDHGWVYFNALRQSSLHPQQAFALQPASPLQHTISTFYLLLPLLNSTLVRFKLLASLMRRTILNLFQFHIGSTAER